MRIEDLLSRSREEVAQIWLQYHDEQEKRAGSVLSAEEYEMLTSRAKEW